MQLTDAEYVLLRDCRVVAVAALAPGLRVGAGPRPGQLAADALGGIARRPLGPTAVPWKKWSRVARWDIWATNACTCVL